MQQPLLTPPTKPQTLAQMVKAKYPGEYDDIPDAELESKVKAKYPGEYDDVPLTQGAPASLPSGQAPGIGRQLLDTGLNTLGQAAKSTVAPVVHPLDFLSSVVNMPANLIKAQSDQSEKAYAAFQRGDRSEGVLRAIASIVPILGPIAANYTDADQAGKEQIAGGLIGGMVQGRAMAPGNRVPITPAIRNPNPVAAEANAFAQQHGIPVDAATATGSPVVRGVQHLADRSLGGAFVAPRAQAAQESALTTTGRGLAERVSPAASSPYQAGEAIQQAVTARVGQYSNEANAAYDTLRQIESKNVEKVTIRVPTTAADGTTKISTVTTEMGMPVNLRLVKGQLRPLYERMMRQMPVAQQQADASLHAIKNILDSPDYLPASMVDMDLSAIKKLARSEAGGARDVNQGMAAAAVKSLEGQLQTAVMKAGPEAVEALKAGRAATIGKYGASDLLDSLRQEPVQVFEQATWRGDAGVDKLQNIAKQAPDTLPQIGRAYLDNLIDTATQEGGFGKAKTVQTKWENLGPKTKALLFPDAAMRSDLDNFFRVAKNMAENPNPSGSGHLVGLGAQGMLMVTEPITGASIALTGGALSKLLHSPTGVRMLTQGLSIPVGSRSAQALAVTSAISRAIGENK